MKAYGYDDTSLALVPVSFVLGVCAGAGTPQPVVALLNRHIASIVNSPGYRALIEKAGSIPISSTPEELRKVLIDTYEQVAKSLG